MELEMVTGMEFKGRIGTHLTELFRANWLVFPRPRFPSGGSATNQEISMPDQCEVCNWPKT